MPYRRCAAPRLRPVAVLLAFLVVVAAGCGGGDRETARGGVDATPTAATAPGLRSFRYDLAATAVGVLGGVEGAEGATLEIKVAGEVAAADREHLTTRMSLGDSTVQVERIRADGRVWTRDSQQPWVAAPTGTTGGSAGIEIESAALIGPQAHQRMQSALDGLTSEADQVDGEDVLRYRVPADRIRVFLGVPADSPQTTLGRIEGESTLWVTRDTRLPVRLQTTATPSTGGTVRIEAYIRDRNEPIEVAPPAVG